MNYNLLFEPVKIGPVTAPNRFFAAPHATGHGFAQPNGAIAMRETKAEGGWGTVAVQITEISNDTDMANHPIERIWHEANFESHAVQVERIKAKGALTAIELGHGGMRARNFTTGMPVIGPSDLPILRAEIPQQAKAMDKSDIRSFRAAHKRAASLAKRAGYDIIYVYAAHDISILSHFLSRRTNHRSDEYGGSLENRVRLLREVLEDTMEVAAGDRAVALRFAVHEVGAQMALTHDGEGREVVGMLAELPDLWDVNISGWSADSNTSRFSEEGYQLEFTEFVKTVTSKPVVGVGRFTSPDKMVSVIKSGKLDLIGAARPSIADPFLPNKIREGRIEEIRECIGCNACVSMDSYGVPVRCTQNPTISEEWRRGWHPEFIGKAEKVDTVLIIGGGPSGLEAGLTLARAGHRVTIAEAEDEVGGRALKESKLPGLHGYRRTIEGRQWQLQQMGNVDIYTSSPLQASDLADFGADKIIVATGAAWRGDGVGSSHFFTREWFGDTKVLTPDDIMAGATAHGKVVVYDDDHNYMASSIVERLRMQGHEVTYVTPEHSISSWTVYTLEQRKILSRLKELNVEIHVNSSLVELGEGQAQFSNALSLAGPVLIPCDTLVFVGAKLPDRTLFEQARDSLGEEVVLSCGDVLAPGTIQAAIFSGHRIARSILEKGQGTYRIDPISV